MNYKISSIYDVLTYARKSASLQNMLNFLLVPHPEAAPPEPKDKSSHLEFNTGLDARSSRNVAATTTPSAVAAVSNPLNPAYQLP